MAKKSPARRRAATALPIRKNRTRSFAAVGEDPDDNSRIPPGGLRLRNNPDGSFTVRSARHTVTVRAPTGRRGGAVVPGVVVVGAVSGKRLPAGTIAVSDHNELSARLEAEVASARREGATGRGKTKELHFVLRGQHTLDIGKLSAITRGDKTIAAHIHMASDNPKIPPGG